MNCMAVRYGDEMLILDAGMGFPEETAYGVDVCIPDFAFLEEYRDDITAIVLTHGHEDQLGALPYILKKFNVPVYCSHFTAALAESKLEEHDLTGDTLIHRVEPRDVVTIGQFTIEFIRVSHSLVDCFCLAIKTPVGTIVHTGDYKVDDTPVIAEPIDLRAFRRYGQDGVLALLSDSTNATVPGRTASERAVIPAFEEIFAEARGRIIVAAFASSIHRLQIVLDVAQQFNRKVCVLGRSMQKNVEIADRLGYLDIHDGMLVGINETKHYSDHEIVFLVTGSQAEPRAALYQMATQVYRGLTIEEGDTVVLSARIIPGNERTFIDDSGFEEIEYETVRERKKMAYEGMITLIVAINGETGELQGPPQIVAQGVRGFESTNGSTKGAQQVVTAALAGASRKTLADESLLKEHIRLELKRFIQKETGARPVIVPVIQQV